MRDKSAVFSASAEIGVIVGASISEFDVTVFSLV